MGEIVHFPRHARTSLVCRTASVSRVKPSTPRSPAKAISLHHQSIGIEPRARQELTTEGLTPSLSATEFVPPSVSRVSSMDLNIDPYIVRALRTRQVFAKSEKLFVPGCAAMLGMATAVKNIAKRLVTTRRALGLKQSDFCQQIGVEKNVYNPFEKGRRRITVDVAIKIYERFGVSLDWIYCGDTSHLSVELYNKLAAAA